MRLKKEWSIIEFFGKEERKKEEMEGKLLCRRSRCEVVGICGELLS